jgi:chemotaxis protein MotB
MPQAKKKVESEELPGAPEWMVTYSDCMTLLLTFFVLLLSFSSFDEKVFDRMRVVFADALPAVSPINKPNRDACAPPEQIEFVDPLNEGSEKPTLEEGEQGSLKRAAPVDIHNQKVFLMSSERVFWGRGTILSSYGREALATLAAFLEHMPGRVVISENGPDDQTSKQDGLIRSWAVMKHLTANHGLDQRRFSISGARTMPVHGSKASPRGPIDKRVLEIVLLEQNICY